MPQDADRAEAELPQVLLVEDDDLLSRALSARLVEDGIDTETTARAEAALELIDREEFDLLIIDVGLPGMSGFDLIREIRRRRDDVPVMFLTGAATVQERLSGFDLGADDYVVKPANLNEVTRRARALLRRHRTGAPLTSELLGPSDLVLDRSSHRVAVGETQLDLTQKEFAVLTLLLERREEVITADDLSRAVWGYETFGARNFVEKQVSRLRSKLRAAGARGVINTVRGVGYVIR
ncbi:MAG TPA: response regulator transcription factor [Dehalococcoidia bacterium]|nr:response regulator transcription factor [Dehalococcoidia bacterium]